MRIRLAVTAFAALVALAAAPGAHAQSVKFYKVVSAKGTYDTEARYIGPAPDCPGSFEYEEHSDFKLRRTSKGAGGMLVGGVGPLIMGGGGGFDGVYRYLNCSSATSSCEHHFGWHEAGGALITVTFTGRGRAEATLSKTSPLTDSCPLAGKNGFYLGKDKLTRRERRARKFKLKFRQTEAVTKDGERIGSMTSSFTVVVKRTR